MAVSEQPRLRAPVAAAARPTTLRVARLGRLRALLRPLGDLVAGALAFGLAFHLRYHLMLTFTPRFAISPPDTRLYGDAFWLYLILLVAILALGGAYRRLLFRTGTAECRGIVQGVTFALMALLLATDFVDHTDVLSRGWLLLLWLCSCLLLCGSRLLARGVAGRLAASGAVGRRVLIVGVHTEALMMEWLLRRQAHLGLRVVGFVDDAAAGTMVQAGKAVLGGVADLPALIGAHGVDVVMISARASSHEQVLATVEATVGTPAEVVLSPDVFTTLSTGATIVSLPGMPMVQLHKLRLTWGERLVKEIADRLVAALLLLLLSPLLLFLAVISWRGCGGVLERYTALGLGGVPFSALKFRTTRGQPLAQDLDHALAQRRQKDLPVRDDPHVTRCGRLLRRSSLDELPQLWNVVCGQMSLIGPYKISPADLHHYGAQWMSIVTLKPGITGMAQVHGRGELTMEERAILDADYVRTYSLALDASLLLATIPAVLRGRGAF